MRGRLLGILTILLLAPITAELLQAYLGDLGGVGGLVFVVLFFAPMYGGMALLIREVTVRTGRGWSARLLLGAAFGVAMATFIDLSLFTPERDDIDYWDQIMAAASIGGISAWALVSWVGGHVLMSVAAPIVVGESLARQPGPWVPKPWLLVVALGFVGVAGLIHGDQAGANPVTAGPVEYAVSAVAVATLVVLAFTPLGRPRGRRPREASAPAVRLLRGPSVGASVAVGIVGMAALDFVPLSWLGLVVYLVVFAGGLLLLRTWSAAAEWSPRHLAAVTFGALLARTVTGFLSPLPQGTTWPEKISQNCLYLALVLLLGYALHRRTRTPMGWPARADDG